MTKRTFTGKGGETWEWEETPEVVRQSKIFMIKNAK
tara:strand:- start:534 stop:641 length:108 start_codon:yes stop_codon:yes gene_type:complete